MKKKYQALVLEVVFFPEDDEVSFLAVSGGQDLSFEELFGGGFDA